MSREELIKRLSDNDNEAHAPRNAATMRRLLQKSSRQSRRHSRPNGRRFSPWSRYAGWASVSDALPTPVVPPWDLSLLLISHIAKADGLTPIGAVKALSLLRCCVAQDRVDRGGNFGG